MHTRILTTHAGSLPRPEGLRPGSIPKPDKLRDAVAEVVKKQIQLGIDIVNDGEFSKSSFVTYVTSRLSGLERLGGVRSGHWSESRDAREFPDYYRRLVVAASSQPIYGCTGPLKYKGIDLLKTDLDNLKDALKHRRHEAFVPAIAPSNIENWHANSYYKTAEEYRVAIADAMHVEYAAIVDAGFILQIDDPRLITYYMMKPDLSLREVRRWAHAQVEVLNYALRGIPRERIRYHTCYSIDRGPRVHDMEAKDIVDIVLQVRAGAFSFEAANPRHEHEWKIWCDARKPSDAVLIPGVITHSSVLVEHPEWVAERLQRFVDAIGPDRVIAGSDCGFATFASSKDTDPAIVWAKLDALSRGAELAARRLKQNLKSRPRPTHQRKPGK